MPSNSESKGKEELLPCEHKSAISIEFGFSWCIECGALGNEDGKIFRIPTRPVNAQQPKEGITDGAWETYQMHFANKPKEGELDECPHCGMSKKIRNPSGYCDHLYYPENCAVYKNSLSGQPAKKEKWYTEITINKMINTIQHECCPVFGATAYIKEHGIESLSRKFNIPFSILNKIFANEMREGMSGQNMIDSKSQYKIAKEMLELIGPELAQPRRVTVEDIEEVIDLYNDSNAPIDGSKVTWKEYRKHFATAILSLLNGEKQ